MVKAVLKEKPFWTWGGDISSNAWNWNMHQICSNIHEYIFDNKLINFTLALYLEMFTLKDCVFGFMFVCVVEYKWHKVTFVVMW